MLTLPNVTLDHKFFMRFPTSTANPGSSVSRAKYWLELAGGRPAIERSVRARRVPDIKLVRDQYGKYGVNVSGFDREILRYDTKTAIK